MNRPHYKEIRTEYDDDSQGYFVIWQPLAVAGAGKTEQEALEDLRAAAHFGIETMINLKLGEISPGIFARGGENGEPGGTKSGNLGPR